ncbi:ParB N-terminal domain-containing protein [Aquibium sp. A9E412]|uniref:ParB N-terminal domain-containing protein n=1 Tax=Aquibium sp. A9E412 TaxID=2976767 RepID=UPI0025B1DB17|nr:ParB N-terminal domain-containing protein [Aquibium sp. A9E412]MDN2567515.1 ParB N-terminal domain-containing protein [Aquibium sp. A9E412]
MLQVHKVPVDSIQVPAGRRDTLHPATVRWLAEDILKNGMKSPIEVRRDETGYVLVEGLHRLEATKWLGEREIAAHLVPDRPH